MIIFGTRNKAISQETFQGKCIHCGQLATVQFVVVQRYAHVFWIPFFPIGKKGVSVCSHCKQTLTVKEFNDEYREFYNQVKQNRRPPVYMYSGLILLGLLITAAVITGKKDQARLREQVAHPKAGDVYSIKEAQERFTLYKVTDVSKDSVYVLYHMLETNKKSGLKNLKSQDLYDNEKQALSISEIESMHKQGKLIAID
jgi:hypothetical protein